MSTNVNAKKIGVMIAVSADRDPPERVLEDVHADPGEEAVLPEAVDREEIAPRREAARQPLGRDDELAVVEGVDPRRGRADLAGEQHDERRERQGDRGAAAPTTRRRPHRMPAGCRARARRAPRPRRAPRARTGTS